jgi:hypothetical protein
MDERVEPRLPDRTYRAPASSRDARDEDGARRMSSSTEARAAREVDETLRSTVAALALVRTPVTCPTVPTYRRVSASYDGAAPTRARRGKEDDGGTMSPSRSRSRPEA